MEALTALKYDVEVKENGQLSLSVPFERGRHVTVFVIPNGDAMEEWFENTDETVQQALTHVLEKNAELYRRLA